jgi:hypothetical protein
MFGSQPISFLPISTQDHVGIVIISPAANLIAQAYRPTIYVVVSGDVSQQDVNYYIVGTDAIVGAKPYAVAVTFLYDKYIYSKVKLVNSNVQIELINKETGKKAYLTLVNLNKLSGTKNVQLKKLKRFPKEVSIADGKVAIVQE